MADGVEPVEEPTEEELNTNPKLRAAFDRRKAENRALKDTNMDMAFMLAGVPIDKGRGKTGRANYKGEPKADDIKSYMQEHYEWEPPTPPATTPPAAQLGEAIGEAQGRMADTTSGPSTQPAGGDSNLQVQIAEAEQAQDWVRAIELKQQWLATLARKQAGLS